MASDDQDLSTWVRGYRAALEHAEAMGKSRKLAPPFAKLLRDLRSFADDTVKRAAARRALARLNGANSTTFSEAGIGAPDRRDPFRSFLPMPQTSTATRSALAEFSPSFAAMINTAPDNETQWINGCLQLIETGNEVLTGLRQYLDYGQKYPRFASTGLSEGNQLATHALSNITKLSLWYMREVMKTRIESAGGRGIGKTPAAQPAALPAGGRARQPRGSKSTVQPQANNAGGGASGGDAGTAGTTRRQRGQQGQTAARYTPTGNNKLVFDMVFNEQGPMTRDAILDRLEHNQDRAVPKIQGSRAINSLVRLGALTDLGDGRYTIPTAYRQAA